MTTDDLFTNKSLFFHSELFNRIETIRDENIKNIAKLTFTANIANCSKLIPPLKSRGEVSPGAWMTGFYIAKEYLDQNVLHYFQNRVFKTILGKNDFNYYIKKTLKTNNYQELFENDHKKHPYLITNYDAKKLILEDESIDYIFADPPYGSSVPYFEQSILWNNWLKNNVDYENEIVISDSKIRNKNITEFKKDINASFKEIYRVLKYNKYFSMTFNSISGKERYIIISSCIKQGFIVSDFELLTQKTLSPKQLNRKKTINGDILITFQKTLVRPKIIELDETETRDKIHELITHFLATKNGNINDLFYLLLNYFFSHHIIFYEIDFLNEIQKNYIIDNEGFFKLK